MDNDFATKIQSLLSNPEAMSKITAIASTLGGTQSNEPTPEKPSVEQQTSQPMPPENLFNQFTFPQTDPRIALLTSVKPLIKEEKRKKVDSLLNALTVATMLKNFKK